MERQDTDLRELVQVGDRDGETPGQVPQQDDRISTATSMSLLPVNPQEIKQVVLNLITNALDSLDEHGTVEVRLTCRPRHGRAAGHGQWLRHDRRSVEQHVFEPFFTRRRGGQGTGLGLRSPIELSPTMEAKFRQQATGPGTGSTFT